MKIEIIKDPNPEKWVRIYKDKIDTNIEGFEFTYDYILGEPKTYLNLQEVSYFDGSKNIERNFAQGERKKSGLVLARLAIQVFESDIDNLSEDERLNFKTDEWHNTGFWQNREKMLKKYGSHHRDDPSHVEGYYYNEQWLANPYPDSKLPKYFFKNQGLYDSMFLSQELLKEFGNSNQYFEVIVTQGKKSKEESEKTEDTIIEDNILSDAESNYQIQFTPVVITSKNVILRGAPGTGKTHLAKEIASDIVSDGETTDFDELKVEQKEQIGFVQFHPSYDYTDFVEGLRPFSNDGQIGFQLKNGTFKNFAEDAIKNSDKKYVFIIDEINRGEISKIFGELFFSIDPGYRGKKGKVSTQYSNLHEFEEKFYIPENVYIIGTMNDIDRSVDSFDFAMRRRFRFIELKANENTSLLNKLEPEAIDRMNSLNKAITEIEGLSDNYHIGPAYFLKAKEIGFDKIWTDYLEPLLQDYVRGNYNEKEDLKALEKAYNLNSNTNEEIADQVRNDNTAEEIADQVRNDNTVEEITEIPDPIRDLNDKAETEEQPED